MARPIDPRPYWKSSVKSLLGLDWLVLTQPICVVAVAAIVDGCLVFLIDCLNDDDSVRDQLIELFN